MTFYMKELFRYFLGVQTLKLAKTSDWFTFLLYFFPWLARVKCSLLWVLVILDWSPEYWLTVPIGKVKGRIETIMRVIEATCVLIKKTGSWGLGDPVWNEYPVKMGFPLCSLMWLEAIETSGLSLLLEIKLMSLYGNTQLPCLLSGTLQTLAIIATSLTKM